MHVYYDGLWYQTADIEDPQIILGAPIHGGTSRSLLRRPVQSPPGVDQADPLYPTIFNMVVDGLVFHWVMLVAGE